MAAPLSAPTIGTVCANSFCETATPNRLPTWVMNRTSAGAASLMIPRRVRYSAASEMVFENGAKPEIAGFQTCRLPKQCALLGPARKLRPRFIAGLGSEGEHFDAGERG